MRSERACNAGHPNLETLALYSKGDLVWLTRWNISRHIGKCADCEEQVLRFRSVSAEVKREADRQILTGFEATTDWARLEREMIGNIGVGVAAARCIEKVGRGRIWAGRGAWVTVGLAVLFLAGWFTNVPSEQRDHLTASIRRSMGIDVPQIAGTIVRTTPEGIAVRAQGATLTILHPPSAVISLAGSSSLGARFVDEETGEVTITNVYGD
ncbi:MAG: hypothetical protein QOD95_401 [Gammaproteobacteria bacterium]|nr:hypothetical protein [Gammaproteobacteria bacterium]